MPQTGRIQPGWGRSLGAVLAVVLIAIARDAWAVVAVTVAVTMLMCGYLLHRRTCRRPVDHQHRGG